MPVSAVDATTIIRVLLVEDNEGDAELAREALASGDSGCQFLARHAPRLEDALKRLAVEEVDVILLDLGLPDTTGLDTLDRVQKAAPHIPVVIFTGLADDEAALAALHRGAQEFVVKGRLDGALLGRTIRHAIERSRLLHDLEESQRIIEAANRELRTLYRVKSNFLSNVSHELRTPLAAMLGMTENLKDGLLGPLTDRQRDSLQRILVNGARLQSMIDELLDMSRLEEGRIHLNLSPLDLPALFQELVKDFRPACAERRLSLHVPPAPTAVRVNADAARVRQVLGNLITNAIKFTPPEGRIDVSVEEDPSGGSVVFSVCDTGAGIPEESHSRIFDRFYQARRSNGDAAQGFGLGLAICRDLVELHGGSIWVKSRPGQGSCFSFRLPCRERAATPSPARPPA